ncbi:putative DNA binding domain-containing protein [Flavihumibacter sp. RY-1]|uniref:DNA binding domain-containing protein n=1 Tax=Flavihumibacter fluminis TaxID=2909236 RepID=A0ABS9BD27_9BACT|nr:ATP-binding protein [Flavihumibacter fluminis]MCF1713175.1 putative DNA binding domain-containing protein [Flavihumibacter fluminis]
MEMLKDIIERLNNSDESTTIEVKRGSAIDRSIMETICAFSNEPDLGGGTLVLGIERKELLLFPQYEVVGVKDMDKLQLDLASQCASLFNIPVRPEIEIETSNNLNVLKVFIPELHISQKPLYFKNEGLPRGAYRRIGSSDQRCSDDDMILFYNQTETFDSAIVQGSSLDDIDENAISLYRQLRKNVNTYAEELQYNDKELLQALGCAVKTQSGDWKLTYAGLLVFGSRAAHRRLIPMMRVDYIRVPGNEWVADPENRFTTIDMRGPLLELVSRAYSAVSDDLPKGFLLPEGELHAESVGLPGRVLREALVNAFMHRSYRVNEPIQLIRYGNRIELRNPGFSLKPADQLGEPGSQSRNQFIAAIFHETNLAETKGSGIRTMRRLMERAGMAPPTFESDHGANKFTLRLLLHHFLSEEDLDWLNQFNSLNLNDNQKRALIFTREAGAVDNPTYRQLNGCDVFRSSGELRQLKELDLLEMKGKGRYTYLIAGSLMNQGLDIKTSLSGPPPAHSGPPPALSGPPSALSGPPQASSEVTFDALLEEIPENLRNRIISLGKRISNPDVLKNIIIELCKFRPHSLEELSILLQRKDKYLLEEFIIPLRQEGLLKFTLPEMPNHPNQAYTAV